MPVSNDGGSLRWDEGDFVDTDPLLQPSAAPPSQGRVPILYPHACECVSGGRNLVVCIDGTSNQFSKKNTNVVELYNRLIKDPKTQLTYYSSGIGTYARPSWKSWDYYMQIIGHKLDLAVAWRFEDILLDAYRWLADNYEEGDRIYLFGFSRGAYQVRVLSAMIHSVGLIHKGNQSQIPFAYQLYAESEKLRDAARNAESAKDRPSFFTRAMNTIKTFFGGKPAENQEHDGRPPINIELDEADKMLQRFKSSFSRHVQVHFVGAWDTVSSVGIVRDKSLPGTTNGMGHVCFFRHALALHERRIKFLPEYARGSFGPAEEYTKPAIPVTKRSQQLDKSTATAAQVERKLQGATAASQTTSSPRRVVETQPESGVLRTPPVHTKEVWFAGSHAQIGGGVYDNLDLNKFGPALRWISFEAELVGLRLSPDPNEWATVPGSVYQALRGLWRLFEVLPLKRLRFGVEGDKTTRRPHLGRPREIQKNQLIHESALLYINETEEGAATTDRLCARLPQGNSWSTLSGDLIEDDPYTAAGSFLSKISHDSRILYDHEIAALEALLRTGPGRRSLSDSTAPENILIRLMNNYITEAAGSIDSCQKSSSFVRDGAAVFRAIMILIPAGLPIDDRQPVDAIKPFASALATRDVDMAKRFMFSFGSPQVCSPLCSSTLEWFVSISYFPIGSPLAGSLAVGGDSDTLVVWNPDTSSSRSWVAHDSELHAVTISPDGHRISSAAEDSSVRIWNSATGDALSEPLVHPDWVRAVALSPAIGSSLVASGSDDGAVRLWDLPSGLEQYRLSESLVGHNDFVRCVAFSPDAQYIASGSDDKTIRLWSVESRKLLGLWRGHKSAITSVAFSPDGQYLASSGAEDYSICLWNLRDTNSESTLWPFDGPEMRILRGHNGSVNSIAFSPDSKRLASGSDDRTVIAWDTETGEIVWGPFLGHSYEVHCVVFSPDGRRIASCSADKSVRIWDAAEEWWHFEI